MGETENRAFSKKNVKRERRLMRGMEKADKTGRVTKEVAAEKKYYGDPVVKRMGKISYADTKRAMSAEARKRSDKEIDHVYKRRAVKR